MKTIVNYAQKVKEQHALNKTLAPVETDLTDASRSYAIGEQFINDGDLFKAKTAIAQHDALVLDTNYEAADDITTQIKNKTVTTDPVPTEGSTNPVQSNGVFVENRNIYEVMGQNGAKNKEPFDIDVVKALNTTGTWTGNSYELNGITFAFADDGKVTVSGTASALCSINITGSYDLNGSYIISGCPSGGGMSTYSLRVYDGNNTNIADDTGSGVTFEASNLAGCRTNIIVRSGAVIATAIVFAPMIRDSKDTDTTYQPYAKTNQQLTAENEALTKEVAATLNTLGAKNFLETLIGSGTTQGVTYTINADGSITLNGTCTAWTNIKLDYIAGQKNIPSGSYILNGSISGNNKFRLNTYVDGTKMAESENGNEASFTIPSTATEVYTRFEIDSTATFNNETFYPMIRLSSIEDDTYAPYAKTNRELTAENQTLTQQMADKADLADIPTKTSDLTNDSNFVNSTTVDNKHKLTIKTVSTSGWTTDTTSQSGTTLYKKSISLNHVYVESPAVDIATSSGTGLPTTAQQTAYDLLQYVTVDGTTLYLYASAIPSTQFYIGVEGVD